jgi:hypothetical protein
VDRCSDCMEECAPGMISVSIVSSMSSGVGNALLLLLLLLLPFEGSANHVDERGGSSRIL